MKRSGKLRPKSLSDTAILKDLIQGHLRHLARVRDGGCIFRHYEEEAGKCGGYASRQGHLILQAEHLVTRSNSVSYSDMRNIICICPYHHLYFKQQHGIVYWEIVERHIGPERWAWVKRVEADKRPYRYYLSDWQKIEAELRIEVAKNPLTSVTGILY